MCGAQATYGRSSIHKAGLLIDIAPDGSRPRRGRDVRNGSTMRATRSAAASPKRLRWRSGQPRLKNRNWSYLIGPKCGRPSLRLEAGELHHLAPLLGLVGNEPAERRRRAADQDAAELVEACLHFRIDDHRVHLAV